MIPPVPPNFGFTMLAVPVWRWENDPGTPAEPPCNAADASADAAKTAAGATAGKRLVFAGYEWIPQVQWSLFPDAPWEHGAEDQIQQSADASQHQQQREAKHALAPKQPAAALGSRPDGAAAADPSARELPGDGDEPR